MPDEIHICVATFPRAGGAVFYGPFSGARAAEAFGDARVDEMPRIFMTRDLDKLAGLILPPEEIEYSITDREAILKSCEGSVSGATNPLFASVPLTTLKAVNVLLRRGIERMKSEKADEPTSRVVSEPKPKRKEPEQDVAAKEEHLKHRTVRAHSIRATLEPVPTLTPVAETDHDSAIRPKDFVPSTVRTEE